MTQKHERLASQAASATVAVAAGAAAAVAVAGGKRAFSSMVVGADDSGGDAGSSRSTAAVSKVAESVQPEEEQSGEMARLLAENEALRMQMNQQGRCATSSR